MTGTSYKTSPLNIATAVPTEKELGHAPVRRRHSASVSDNLLAEEWRRRVRSSCQIPSSASDWTRLEPRSYTVRSQQSLPVIPLNLWLNSVDRESNVVIKLTTKLYEGLDWPIPVDATYTL